MLLLPLSDSFSGAEFLRSRSSDKREESKNVSDFKAKFASLSRRIECSSGNFYSRLLASRSTSTFSAAVRKRQAMQKIAVDIFIVFLHDF